MIKINDNFKAKHDGRCWVLYETYMGKDKDKNPKEQVRETYHSTLRQVCSKVIDVSAAHCGRAEQIMDMLDKSAWTLEGKVRGYL